MIRSFLYLAKLAAIVFVAVWLADRPGVVSVTWLGWRLDTTVGVVALLLLLLVVALWFGIGAWRRAMGAPGLLVGGIRARRRNAGYRALTEGLVAVAAGDAAEARRQTRRAGQLLDDRPLTLLLAAQTAQLSGDHQAARRFFATMAQDREMAFLGRRGLILQALRDHDLASALSHARAARAARPATPWVLETLVVLNGRLGHWLDAQAALEESRRHKFLTGKEGDRQLAAVLLERARQEAAAGAVAVAVQQAARALKLAPDSLPAAMILAHLHNAADQPKQARRLIEKTWSRTPHPALVEPYLTAHAATTPTARLEAMERLAAQRPADPESRLALAGLALEARAWDRAGAALDPLRAEAASSRLFSLLADLESRPDGDPGAARRWRDRAARESPDPAWVCRGCGAVADTWSAVCGQCGEWLGIEWRPPPRILSPLPRPEPDGTPGDGKTPPGNPGDGGVDTGDSADEAASPQILPPAQPAAGR